MALDAYLKTLDGVDESVSALYKEIDGGGYTLDVNDVTTESGAAYGIANFAALKSALSKERENSSNYKSKLSQYNGIDIDAANEAMEFQSKYKGKTNDDLDSKIEEMRSGFNEKLSAATKATEDAIAAKNNYQIGHAVDAAIMARDDVNPAAAKYLRSEVLNSVGIGENGVFVKDANGNPAMSAQASNTGNMSVSELIGNMANNVESYGVLFKAQGSGVGTGNSSNNGGSPDGGRPSTREAYRALSQTEQVKLYHTDPAYYKELANG